MDKKTTAAERIARMKASQESLKEGTSELVEQLTHTADGEPDFSEIAKKLEQRQAEEKKGENDGYVKMTIYIREDIAAGFNALITKRGQQKEFANQAISDFVLKKSKELGIK